LFIAATVDIAVYLGLPKPTLIFHAETLIDWFLGYETVLKKSSNLTWYCEETNAVSTFKTNATVLA